MGDRPNADLFFGITAGYEFTREFIVEKMGWMPELDEDDDEEDVDYYEIIEDKLKLLDLEYGEHGSCDESAGSIMAKGSHTNADWNGPAEAKMPEVSGTAVDILTEMAKRLKVKSPRWWLTAYWG